MILAKKTSIARPVLRHKECAGLRYNLNLGMTLCPSHNSGYAVRADYCPHPNCPTLSLRATSHSRGTFDKIRSAHLVEWVRAKRGSLREPSSNKG